ncbi:MAG TPA: hypothetical protein VD970_08105 [Acetobacteraceae bacterium]|nr:hypothetical protein [Acetobacteraceae bacterium]
MTMRRRDLLLGTGAAAMMSRPVFAQPVSARVLKFLPQTDFSTLDPIWTTSNVTRIRRA